MGHSDRELLLAERSNLLSDWTDDVLDEISDGRSGDPQTVEQIVGLVEMWSDWGDDALELLDDMGTKRAVHRFAGLLSRVVSIVRVTQRSQPEART